MMKGLTKSFKSFFIEKKECNNARTLTPKSTYSWNGYEFNVCDYNFTYFKNFILRSIVDKISNDVADILPLLPKNNGFWNVIDYPNATQTWREVVKDHIARKLIDGTVYSYITLNDDFTINTLQAIPNKDVSFNSDNKHGFIDYFDVNQFNDGMIRIKNYFTERLDKRNTLYKWSEFNATSRYQNSKPKSRIKTIEESLDYVELANRFNTVFFKNGAKPGYALSLQSMNGLAREMTDKEKEELRADFYSTFGGDNAGRVVILDDGMKLEPLTTSIDKLDIVNNIKEMAQLICMPFFIQPELLGISSGATGAAYKVNEELRLYYYNSNILPMIREWCDYCNRNFIFRYNPDTQPFKNKLSFDETKISVIMAERYRILESQFRCGIFTVNEIRDTIGYKPLQGMDDILANTNWTNPNQANYKEKIEENKPVK